MDSQEYDRWARTIAAGDWLGRDEQPPVVTGRDSILARSEAHDVQGSTVQER